MIMIMTEGTTNESCVKGSTRRSNEAGTKVASCVGTKGQCNGGRSETKEGESEVEEGENVQRKRGKWLQGMQDVMKKKGKRVEKWREEGRKILKV